MLPCICSLLRTFSEELQQDLLDWVTLVEPIAFPFRQLCGCLSEKWGLTPYHVTGFRLGFRGMKWRSFAGLRGDLRVTHNRTARQGSRHKLGDHSLLRAAGFAAQAATHVIRVSPLSI